MVEILSQLPAHERSSPWRRNEVVPIALILLLLALVPFIANLLGEPFLIRVFTRAIIFAIAAAALNIVLGFGGFVSLLHAGLFGIGGYVVGILAQHEFNTEPLLTWPLMIPGSADLAILLPLALIISALAAVLMGIVSLRTSGPYFIMITLAFNQMLYYFFVALQRYGGEDGLQILSSLSAAGLPVGARIPFYFGCLALLALVMIFILRLVNSRFGIILRAIAQNERRVTALGVPLLRYKLVAFAISGAITGFAGALLASGQQFISPADMSWVRSGDLVVMAVLGGLSTVWGPVIGAILFIVLELVLSSWTQFWHLPFGFLIILIVLFLHGGLADLWRLAMGQPPQAPASEGH